MLRANRYSSPLSFPFSGSPASYSSKCKTRTTCCYQERVPFIISISIDFDDFTFLFIALVFVSIEKIYQTLETLSQCFVGYPNTSKFVKNTPLCVVFSALFSVLGYDDETLSLEYDFSQNLLLPFWQKDFIKWT